MLKASGKEITSVYINLWYMYMYYELERKARFTITNSKLLETKRKMEIKSKP